MNERLHEVAVALERRGYVSKVMTCDEARQHCRTLFAGVNSVGWGGSETVKELGLRELAVELKLEIRDHRTDCELFLLSANALTSDGRIVNIDGTGNRVAASIYGPKHVVYLIGRNKLVAGGIDEAIIRVKRFACPPNCRRLNKSTPCASGECPAVVDFDRQLSAGIARPVAASGCDSADRICKATVIFERPPTRTPTTVILIDADLGF